jgi:PAS domain S-box-containing protein
MKRRQTMGEAAPIKMVPPVNQQFKGVPLAVIDDNEQNLYTVTRYLRRAGFEVWEGRTGAEALSLAAKRPDLIILDVKLPDVIGYDVCRQIKSNPITASIPVLHTSATFLDIEDKVTGLEGGADGYLMAPIKPEELIATVRALLRMRTAEKKAEHAASQWQATFDAISSGVCLLDHAGRLERCNVFLEELAGRPAIEIIGRPFDEVAQWISLNPQAYRRMRQTQQRESEEMQGGDRWWRLSLDPVFDQAGVFTGAVAVISDISERKRTEIQLRRNEENLSDFFDNAPIALHWAGPDGAILRVNQEELTMLGYSQEEYLGHKVAEFHVSKVAAEDIFSRLHRGETLQNYEAQLRCKDGSIKDVLISKNVLWEEGRFIHTRCFTRDITPRKQAERRLRTQYEVTRLLVESSSLQEAAPNILKVICETTGWEAGALWRVENEKNQVSCVDLWRQPSIQAPDFESATRKMKFAPGDSLPGDTWQRGQPVWIPDLKQGTSFSFPRAPIAVREGFHAALAVPIRFGEQVIGIFEFFSGEIRQPDPDLLKMLETIGSQLGLFMERKRAEESLASVQEQLRNYAADLEQRVAERTERLQESNRSLESFCYSIAHDLRAPVRAMEGLTAALAEDYGANLDQTGQEYTERIMLAARWMDQLIQDLLSYGRISHMELPMKSVSLDPILERVRDDLSGEIQSKQGHVQFESQVPRIWANPTALKQILHNLVENGLKFSRPNVPPMIQIKAEETESAFRISVGDNGIGIPLEYQTRIFQVFERVHATKDYPGTGIGLALVKKAIERMGGTLSIESQPGEGSCFWFELPKPAAPHRKTKNPGPEPA